MFFPHWIRKGGQKVCEEKSQHRQEITIAVTDTATGKAESHVPDVSSKADLRREPYVFSPACVEEGCALTVLDIAGP